MTSEELCNIWPWAEDHLSPEEQEVAVRVLEPVLLAANIRHLDKDIERRKEVLARQQAGLAHQLEAHQHLLHRLNEVAGSDE